MQYRRALDCPGGNHTFARVGLAAVLCDQQTYEEAFALSAQAIEAERENPAALTVAARCLEETAQALRRRQR